MDTTEILNALTHDQRFPVDAIRASDADRAAVLPVFLEAIEGFVARTPTERQQPDAVFFIFHMLGSWREKSAYWPLARLLRFAKNDVRHAIGEGVTETCHRVMAAVFDGDPQPLYDIILDRDADEYVRSRMCQAIAIVTLRGELLRSEAARFLAACFDDLEPKVDCFVWCGWHDAIAMLGLAELRPMVVEAFKRGSIASWVTEIRFFESDLAKSLQYPDGSPWLSDKEFSPFGDTVDELSGWYGFSEKYEEDMQRRAEREQKSLESAPKTLDDLTAWRPIVNPLRHVGRNDPYPCGSGKKYKRCCLN